MTWCGNILDTPAKPSICDWKLLCAHVLQYGLEAKSLYKGNEGTKENIIKSMCVCQHTHKLHVKDVSRVILPEHDSPKSLD